MKVQIGVADVFSFFFPLLKESGAIRAPDSFVGMADSKFVRQVGVCRYAFTSLGSLRGRIVRYVGGIRYVPATLDFQAAFRSCL